MSVTPQAPDASSSNDPSRPATGPQYVPQQEGYAPYVPQQQGAGNLPPWTGQAPQPPAPRATNTAATTGFVLALIAAVVACIPLLGTVSWILAPLGIVFAIVGLSRATPARGGVGRPMAIWGIVLGAIALVICAIYVTAIAKAANTSTVSSGSSGYSAPYTYTAPAPSYTYTPPSYSSGSSSGSSSSSSSAGSAAAPAADPNTFSAGTYEVGTEIQPGTYKTTGSDWCYFERDKNLDGDLNSIIANDNVQGQGVMQVKSSDKYIKFDGTCTWTKK
ncbi:DUF4190 domain-containing protein [Actinomycetospora sp. TBRC 11914]|uniref:DUF4190 domain-containing protein n=1 Tax=Actinomycetospora sp. TBRC 11914 TaxID=2729387 RepID=UPI00145D2141|nr:DUF4190 domain-containing protein [Actinomycetospora sp. TBRC 11914]NMO89989.1 DUF4190 domain-containing protein [Actinomycetospora sp. TBRC 11914]